MPLKELHLRLIAIGEQADKLCRALPNNHRLHMHLRDLANVVAIEALKFNSSVKRWSADIWASSMSMFTLLSFAAKLGAIEADLKLAGTGILAEWCWNVRQNAMDAISTYKYGWAPLSPEVVARHGDTPLYETGQLKNSIGIKLYHDRGAWPLLPCAFNRSVQHRL
jgi:hypothetical protein